MAVAESLLSTGFPWRSISPPSEWDAIPNIVSNNSVLLEPTNPATPPKISPFLNSKDTFCIEG